MDESFNAMLQQFVDELARAFPGEAKLALYARKLPVLAATQPAQPRKLFMAAYGASGGLITARDEALFAAGAPSLFGDEIDVAGLWASAPAATRDAIWQYLGTLYVLASTMSLVPPGVLSDIQHLAEQAASQMAATGADAPDLGGLMAALPGMVQQIAGGLAQAAPPQQRRA